MGVTPRRILGLLLGLGFWTLVHPTQPRRSRGKGPASAGAPAVPARPGAPPPAASPALADSGIPEAVVPPARGAALFARPAPQATRGTLSSGLDPEMWPGAVATLGPPPSSASRAERR